MKKPLLTFKQTGTFDYEIYNHEDEHLGDITKRRALE